MTTSWIARRYIREPGNLWHDLDEDFALEKTCMSSLRFELERYRGEDLRYLRKVRAGHYVYETTDGLKTYHFLRLDW